MATNGCWCATAYRQHYLKSSITVIQPIFCQLEPSAFVIVSPQQLCFHLGSLYHVVTFQNFVHVSQLQQLQHTHTLAAHDISNHSRQKCTHLMQWRTGPRGNWEISRWAPAPGSLLGPRPYTRIYFINNQFKLT